MANPTPPFSAAALSQVILALASFLLMLVILNGTSRNFTGSDPRYTLLSSQVLLKTGRLKLNPEVEEANMALTHGTNQWQVWTSPRSGAKTYTYPVGNVVFAVPFVWVANRLGFDMLVSEHDTALQRFISAMQAILVMLVLWRIGRHYLDEVVAALAAFLFVVSTTVMSTFGTALWSHNLATLLLALVVLQMVRQVHGKRVNLWLFGCLLFASWLARPTCMAFGGVAFLWMAWHHRLRMWKALLPIAVLMGLFVLLSLDQFGVVMHSYYMPSAWQYKVPWGSNIPEYLFSPGRGLFTFTPLLLFALAGPAFRALRKDLLWWAMLGGFLLHLTLLTRHECWWAGWCYGPRFFTEVHAGFFVMLVMLVRQLMDSQRAWLRQVSCWLGAASISFGVFVHPIQGLYNPTTWEWNDTPEYGSDASFITWNWRYPQFLANDYRVKLKRTEYDYYKRTELLAAMAPQDANLMVGTDHPDYVSFVHHWDRENLFGKGRVVSNGHGLLRAKANVVYALPDNETSMITRYTRRAEYIRDGAMLGAFVKAHLKDHVLIAVQGDGISCLSDESKGILQSLGMTLDTLPPGSSYVCHLYEGKVVKEAASTMQDVKVETHLGFTRPVTLQSGGLGIGDYCSVQVNRREYAEKQRGVNVLVVKDGGEMVARRTFDTGTEDAALPHLVRFVKE